MDDPAFPYQLAASDLDGTLLGPRKEISPANVAAVRRLQKAGARVVLASGRWHQNAMKFQRQLGLEGLVVSCAGASVRDSQTDETLYEACIPPALADELVAEGEKAGHTVIYYHREHLYVNTTNQWTDLYQHRTGAQPERYPGSLRGLQGEAVQKIVWYGEPTVIQGIRAAVEKEYAGRLIIVATDPENLEFLATGADKAQALATVCRRYGVAQEATLAFGDGENDAPMLRWAGLGVAMDGGNTYAKEAADLVSPDGAPEDSFARGVEAVFTQVRRPNLRSNSP